MSRICLEGLCSMVLKPPVGQCSGIGFARNIKTLNGNWKNYPQQILRAYHQIVSQERHFQNK